jgi:penicillin-binding protein 1A
MQTQCLWFRRIVSKGWKVLIYLVIITMVFVGYLVYQLPDINTLTSIQFPLPTYLYSREGELMAVLGARQHQAVQISEVPPLLCQAFLVTEDKRFFQHRGVDVYGLLRASVQLLKKRQKSQGGSTITMQLARNYYLSGEKTFLRKIKEILLALKIERAFTKEQILELYLNKIYMGHRAFGIGAAAQLYLQKSLDQLTLAEMALLAGMPQAPAILNPITNIAAAKKRRNLVLLLLYQSGSINKEDYDNALTEAVVRPVLDAIEPSLLAPYAVDMAQEAIHKILGQDALKGYHVYTTLESWAQRFSNIAVFDSLVEYDQQQGYRGPEKQLGTLTGYHAPQLLAILKQRATIHNLEPAIVMECGAQQMEILLSKGERAIIDRPGWDWILTDKKTSINQYLKPGDIIRVYRFNSMFYLGQIPQVQGALIALDPRNGAVKAVTGGFSYTLSQFNRAIQAARQTGSSLKPFIYAAAFEKGYNLSDVFNDAPLVFDIPGKAAPWRPQNVSKSFYGLTRLRIALVTSVNLATIRLLQAIGISYVLEVIQRFGFNTQKWPHNLTLALGSVEATPLAMAQGYAIFANGGYRITPHLIDHITDYQGHLVYQANPLSAPSDKGCNTALKEAATISCPEAPKVLSEEAVFLVNSALQGVIPYSGKHFIQTLGRTDLAGKTGTTNDAIDCWFIGYHPDQWVSSVWMGYDNRRPLRGYAYTTALRLWVRFMKKVLEGVPKKPFIMPKGVVMLPIQPETGLPIYQTTRDALHEYFQASTINRYQPAATRNARHHPVKYPEEPLF